jgi:DNA-binding transcriptional MerR regulator
MPEGARKSSLTIGALSRATGIPSATLRTWERRYKFPHSVRKPSGHRLYSIEGVAHLLRVKFAIALGHRPAEILRLPAAALETLVTLPAEPRRPATQFDDREVDLLQSVISFDRAGLERGLRSRWESLGPIRFLDECVGPLLESLGTGWRERRLGVRHEHFGSSLLAGHLRELRRPYDDLASGPWVAAATFPGDRHEIGLLMASLVCAVRGWRVLYIGVDTPIDQIVALSREVPLSAIAMSVSPTVPQAYAFALTLELRRELPEQIAIWIGGKGSFAVAPGVLPFIDLVALDRHLAAIAGGSTAGGST